MLRFGTVGSGWIADEYIQGAKDSGLWELTAVYSRTQQRAQEYACLLYTSIHLEDDRVLFKAKAADNTLLERWAFEESAQFFKEVFGLSPEPVSYTHLSGLSGKGR